MIQLIVLLIGTCVLTYLSYQKLLKNEHIIIKIVASIAVFCVSFVAIFIALVVVGVIPFIR